MKLLVSTQPAEVPTETLLVRLRCRRAAIKLAAVDVTASPFPDVVSWVYQRLNQRLRKRLAPFLDLLATRNLTLALRYILAGESPPAALLNNALLAEPLLRLIATAEESKTTVKQLEAVLAEDYPFVAGLTATYGKQGPGGVEQQLADGILLHGLACASNDMVRVTLRYLIDMRNIMMIKKLWRWQVSHSPSLTAGGLFATTNLQHIWSAHDSERLGRLTAQLTGEVLSSTEVTGMEQCLLRGLTRCLRRAGRDPLGLAVVIEYLWRAQLAVHNQLLQQTLAPDRPELLEEVLLL